MGRSKGKGKSLPRVPLPFEGWSWRCGDQSGLALPQTWRNVVHWSLSLSVWNLGSLQPLPSIFPEPEAADREEVSPPPEITSLGLFELHCSHTMCKGRGDTSLCTTTVDLLAGPQILSPLSGEMGWLVSRLQSVYYPPLVPYRTHTASASQLSGLSSLQCLPPEETPILKGQQGNRKF